MIFFMRINGWATGNRERQFFQLCDQSLVQSFLACEQALCL